VVDSEEWRTRARGGRNCFIAIRPAERSQGLGLIARANLLNPRFRARLLRPFVRCLREKETKRHSSWFPYVCDIGHDAPPWAMSPQYASSMHGSIAFSIHEVGPSSLLFLCIPIKHRTFLHSDALLCSDRHDLELLQVHLEVGET